MSALIFRRHDHDGAPDESENNTMRNLLVTLVALVAFGIALGGSLYIIRRTRKQRKAAGTLPSYEDSTRNSHRLTIQTSQDSSFVFSEKQNLIDNSSPMPQSPDNVPEIRITFPEEEDKNGRRVSGRVMVVQVGEAGVGFVRPLDQQPPAYNSADCDERYSSVDLERIGGLKELR